MLFFMFYLEDDLMFAERFDALMNVAEVSNSLLGRSINMNPSHIGRLRKGVRALAKKHDYLPAICTYLTKHIEKDCPSKQEELYKSLKNRVLRIPDFFIKN